MKTTDLEIVRSVNRHKEVLEDVHPLKEGRKKAPD